MIHLKKGFTLIELLIVIALLGALAIGLLAALDPFEQLKKGTDTGTRNTVGELQQAIIRYYGIKNYMPWCTDGQTCTDPATPTVGNDVLITDAIADIVATGELKTDFVELAGGQLSNMYVTGTNDPPVVAVCFKPTSKSFISNPSTKYNQDGTAADPADCPSPTADAAAECYYCIK